MLTKAQSPESTEHAQVVDFLRRRNQQIAAATATAPPRPAPKPEKEPRGPLLRNIAGPAEPPKYVGTPRPTESLSRPRRVPSLAADSFGYPFLRYAKPQPEALNKMVRKNRYLWESKINNIIRVEEDLAPSCLLEDKWEEEMHQQMVRAGLIGESGGPRTPDEETYLWSAMQSKLWYEWRLENMWQHWTARGEAMHGLVLEERALAAKEKGEQGDSLPALADSFRGSEETRERAPQSQTREDSGPPPNLVRIQEGDAMPAQRTAMTIKKELADEGIPFEEDPADPFVSPVWPRLAERCTGRMKRWVRRIQGSNKGRDEDTFSSLVRAQKKATQ